MGVRKRALDLITVKIQNSEETVSPSECSQCGMCLKTAEVKSLEKRKKIDIFYEIQTHTVTSEVKDCPSCGARNKGQFPKGMSGPLQYGIGIRASIINFIIVQMLSFRACWGTLHGAYRSNDFSCSYVEIHC